MTTQIPVLFDFETAEAVRSTQQLTLSVRQLNVVVAKSEDELDKTGREARQTGREFQTLNRGVSALRTAFVALGAAATGSGLVRLADRAADLQNRIRPLVGTTEELAATYEALDAIALRTQGTIDTSVELFARLRIATRDLGLEIETTVELVEVLNNLQRITVSSTQEATNAIRQFSQGLASGRFSGEELRSVLENLPDLARIIARELNVTIGELRRLGEEGKLGPDVLVRALTNASDEIRDLADNQVPTAARGFSVLGDQLADTAARFVDATLQGRSFGQVLIDIAESLDGLDDSIAPIAIRISSGFKVITSTAELVLFALEGVARGFKNLVTGSETSEEAFNRFAARGREATENLNAALEGLFATNEELLAAAEATGFRAGASFSEGILKGLVRNPERERELLEDLEEIRREQDETELDRIRRREEEKLAIINEARERGLITEQEAERRSLNISLAGIGERLSLVGQFTEGLASQLEDLEGVGKAFFVINKTVAIAEATINTAQAVTKALASAPYPLNIAFAAATAAAGAAQVAAITATTIQGLQVGGEVQHMTRGGPVPGAGSGDRVPAMLEPGEIVVNRRASARFRPQLLALNRAVPRFQVGGEVAGLGAPVTGSLLTAGARVVQIDARGSDIGTVQRIEQVLADQQRQLNEMPERIRRDRRNEPGFFKP